MAMIRYTPLTRDEFAGEWIYGKRDSAMASANLVIAVEPFTFGRYGTEEGATIFFLDGQKRHVCETVEVIVARLRSTTDSGVEG